MMDSDDDDIYPDHEPQEQQRPQSEAQMEDVDDDEEEGEEVEDDSDDEINFITDAKEAPKTENISTTTSQPKRPVKVSADTRTVSTSTPIPSFKSESTPQPTTSQQELKVEQSTDSRPGSSYPARHTSTLDPLNGNPVFPVTGKPLLSTDLDVDFGEDDKPWRKPGADITDYFNYSFDEFTWASYCLKKSEMPKEIKEIKDNAEQMKNFLEGMGGGFPGVGMPGMPAAAGGQAPSNPAVQQGGNTPSGAGAQAGQQSGMSGMPGMPSEAEMQQMFQAMMAQGVDPSQMDSNQFMAMMMGGGGQQGGAVGGFGAQQQVPPSGPAMGGFGGNGFDQGNTGFGGRGRGRRGRGNW